MPKQVLLEVMLVPDVPHWPLVRLELLQLVDTSSSVYFVALYSSDTYAASVVFSHSGFGSGSVKTATVEPLRFATRCFPTAGLSAALSSKSDQSKDNVTTIDCCMRCGKKPCISGRAHRAAIVK